MPLTTITDGGGTTRDGRRRPSLDSLGSLSCDSPSLDMDFQDSMSEIDHPRPQQQQQGRGQEQRSQSSLFERDDHQHQSRAPRRPTRPAMSNGGHARGASSASVASAASQRENEARIREAKYIIASLRSTVDQLQDALGEATSAADEVEAENATLRQEVKHLTKEREQMIQLVTKVKKIANFLKEDAQQADAEASELRLEVEALKIERDRYKATAEGKATLADEEEVNEIGHDADIAKDNETTAGCDEKAADSGANSDAAGTNNDSVVRTETKRPTTTSDKTTTRSRSSGRIKRVGSDGSTPTHKTAESSDKTTTRSRSSGRIKRVGSDGSTPTHKTAESSPSGSKSIYSSNGSIQNGVAIKGTEFGTTDVPRGDLVEEDFDEDGDPDSAERRIPAFAPINTVAVRRRGKQKSVLSRCSSSSIASASSRVDVISIPDVALVQECGRSA